MRSHAIGWLARRDLSRATLIGRIRALGATVEAAEQIARWCEERGFLCEGRLADNLSRRLGARFGTRRIARHLRDKGIDAAHAASALGDLQETEFARAWAVWTRRFGVLPTSSADSARQQRFLVTRGFSGDIVRRILRGEIPEESSSS
ncbi:MAG TPA: regulatory protein RecX [Usitatibacteraceae bacterium]|nr:regulatory protein RecX [Usitatibacteraceae bacterium]